MVGSDFLNQYQQYQAFSLLGINDFADRLSYVYTTVILAICTIVVTTKTYMMSAISCYVPTKPSGVKFGKYFNAYCWITGTIPFRRNESLPQTPEDWEDMEDERKVLYYQWIPFMLGLQMILFLLPFLIWWTLSYNRLGTDIAAIVKRAVTALETSDPAAREKHVASVARRLEMLLFAHREVRHSRMAQVRRRMTGALGVCFVSKRVGTWIVFAYLVTKLLFLANAVGQLFLIKRFLAVDQPIGAFVFDVMYSLTHGSDWRTTLFFPRMSYCAVNLRHLGAEHNRFLGTCILTVNMLAEKIYIFLWLWILFVAVMSCVSLVQWMVRLHVRRNQASAIRKYLKLGPPPPSPGEDGSGAGTPKSVSWAEDGAVDPNDPRAVDRFVREFLRKDGVFVVNLLTLNAGDIVTGEIVRLLWKAWLDRYAGKKDFRNDSWENYRYPEDDYPPPAYDKELEALGKPSG